MWERAATSLHDDVFLIPKNVTSERSVALLPTLIRWWEWLRCQDGRKGIVLGGTPLTDGRNGGAEPSVWETLLEMERFDCRVGEKDQGAITAFERASLPVVWAWPTRFDLARKILRLCCAAVLNIRGAFSLKGVSRSRSKPQQLSSFGRHGAACSFAVCSKML